LTPFGIDALQGYGQITVDLGVVASLSAVGAVELAASMFFSPNGMDEPPGAPLSTPIRSRRRLLFVQQLPRSAHQCAWRLAGVVALPISHQQGASDALIHCLRDGAAG
jgi:hypothetical protein